MIPEQSCTVNGRPAGPIATLCKLDIGRQTW